jgi:ADP-ribose pyrophosphatase YjhB (NUDIX family)
MSPRIRAVGIVIRSENILLIHRLNEGRGYWVFPGGGVEESERVEDTVVRELKEETLLDIAVGKLLYHVVRDDLTEEFFYLCDEFGGDLKLSDTAPELLQEGQFFTPVWIPIEQLSQLLVYPTEIRDQLLLDIAHDFKDAPREIKMKSF